MALALVPEDFFLSTTNKSAQGLGFPALKPEQMEVVTGVLRGQVYLRYCPLDVTVYSGKAQLCSPTCCI